tara:strand:- start:199 stop:501 length:303 start_codon:yes stop_codon:yes gene_type:complete
MFAKLKKNYFLLISTFLFLYFFFNLLDGERGLISLIEKKSQLNNLKLEEIKLSKKIENLELNNSLLTENLDLDYIETLIRQKFLFGKKNEEIYIIEKNEN